MCMGRQYLAIANTSHVDIVGNDGTTRVHAINLSAMLPVDLMLKYVVCIYVYGTCSVRVEHMRNIKCVDFLRSVVYFLLQRGVRFDSISIV